MEQVLGNSPTSDEIEELLKSVWQNSYAYYANRRESQLMELFVKRGRVLHEKIYPEQKFRRKLYRVSLPPRSGNQLLKLSEELREHLQTGVEYANWSLEQRLIYIQETVRILGSVTRFKAKDKTRKDRKTQEDKVIVSWENVLRWWLAPSTAKVKPTYKQISDWHSYVSKTFHYRVNWGLGSIIALLIEESFSDHPTMMPTIEDWPLIGLPWAAFWIKELIVWGTLEPVAAYLLSRGMEITRPDAEKAALSYYNSQRFISNDEKLNAKLIKQWAESRYDIPIQPSLVSPPYQIAVKLLRDFSNSPNQLWRVIPVENSENILWIDPAGYPLATSLKPEIWDINFLENYDFDLNVGKQTVYSNVYL
ncbi:MAG: hypothetical protein H6667_00680 [Ardenticatenaceae bacterium]|nr:hypothetical protein [Ardenticatenaceae bacterium]